MRKIIQFAVFLSLAAFTTGCATPYMVDRGRDAADIFTATVGYGGGAKVRVGPIQTGIFANLEGYGLRGGYFGDQFGGDDISEYTIDYDFFIQSKESYGPRKFLSRGKGINSSGYFIITIPHDLPWDHFANNKAPYYTQIEVAVGIHGTLRLGFNPGELLDFILGWITIDIYNDDTDYF